MSQEAPDLKLIWKDVTYTIDSMNSKVLTLLA